MNVVIVIHVIGPESINRGKFDSNSKGYYLIPKKKKNV